MSDTPQTDEAQFILEEEWLVTPDFARELERELNAVKTELAKLKATYEPRSTED